jgi:hypothetical protein
MDFQIQSLDPSDVADRADEQSHHLVSVLEADDRLILEAAGK